MNVIPEKRRTHYIWYLRFYWYNGECKQISNCEKEQKVKWLYLLVNIS